MTSPLKPSAGLLLWAILASAGAARAADANVIRAVEVAERGGALELAVQGSRPPSYSVFKLQDPPRLVIDLAGADVSAVASPTAVGKAGVVSVSTAQYRDERSTVGRVIVTLDGPRRYEVAPRGEAVVVRILGAEAAAAAAAPALAAVAPAPQAEPAAPVAAKVAPAVPESPAQPSPAPAASAATPAAGDDHVVSRRVDVARPGAHSATAVTAVRPGPARILLATDGEVARVEILELRDPPRLVLDLQGVVHAPRGAVALEGAFSQLRFGKADGKVRVVLDAAGPLPAYEVKRVKGGLAVVPQALAAAPRAEEPARVRPVAAPAAPASVTSAAAPRRARISAVRFSGSGDAARIELSGRAPFAISRPDLRTAVLTLEEAELPAGLERSLDTTAFKGPVQMVSSFNQPTTGQVRIVVSLRGPATDRVVETAGGLAWSFSGTGEAPAAAPVKIEASGAQAAGLAAEAPGYALSGARQARGYTGRRIALDFHDIDIRNLLRLIADVSKKNIVVADDVTGKVTVSLRNVPWDQALDLVLRSKGLGKEEMGNVIRIARLEELAKEQQARADAEKARAPLVPLKVRIIPINFARASEIIARVKEVLTDRGVASSDDRTNVLIVKDVPEALVRAEGLVRNLDTETPQVLIEARIIEASSTYNRALGVQWGGTGSATQAKGTSTGLVFPNSVTAAGTAGSNYVVNMPAAVSSGSGGGIGFTFGSIGGAVNLSLALSALENSGQAKTISAPKIATLDNKEATIGQGTSIPYQTTSASSTGAVTTSTSFVEAKLELKVTPHVTADGSVLLKIKASNNSPNTSLTGSDGQPSISKREAETEVLVKDGDTTVIGGIYTRATSVSRKEVPWFGKIPILGFFFRSNTNEDDHTELLIFITPRIMNRSATTAAAAN